MPRIFQTRPSIVILRHFRRTVALLMVAGLHPPPLSAQTGTLTIDTGTRGTAIPPTLFGAFFEEINLGGEGGLYGEMVQNRSFNSSSNPDLWSLVTPGTAGWTVKSGVWSIDTGTGAYQQTANGEDCRSTCIVPGGAAWTDYTLTLQARKPGGAEGFLILFHTADANNYFWWNIGGWTNTAHAIQQSVNGARSVLATMPGSINTGRWYDIKIIVQGNSIECYLDNVLTQSFTTGSGHAGGIGLSTWNTQAQFRNIVVTSPDTQVLYQSDFQSAGGAAGEISVDNSKPLNATNADSLKLTMLSGNGRVGAANAGFFGIPVKAGAACDLSLHACTESYAGLLTARLESADGGTVYAETSFNGLSANWRKFSASLIPAATDANARLVISIDQPGSVRVDVVSLFPQTFKNRPNGLRADLATAVADLNPGFLRFPGGCFVEGRTLATAYRWKKSIGDISERPGLASYWSYQSSNGLGYHEYLQYCEDIGAEPLFCINTGMSHGGVQPLDQMGEYVQDALDAIEYANGDVSTTWGARRSAAGHPAPFHMKYIQVGNENGGTDYNDRYALFYDAIKAAWPDMNVIACVWGGTPTSRPFDLMDEHYYTNPATMQAYATKYDNYSRSGPKVFVGEYAVTSGHGTFGNLAAAVAEAAFMTGIERNCDVVRMASYAPLFCSLNMQSWKWMPDAIYFDNTQWFGTPAYHVQKMFANNMGDVLLPLTQDFNAGRAGSIGLSTWNTQAEFRNIVVTSADSQVLYQSEFESGTGGWTANSGTWAVNTATNPDAYRQSATGTDRRSTFTTAGSGAWKDYTLTLQARKQSGSEGFLIMFYVADANNWLWWNLGGWNNTSHAVENCVNGAKSSGPKVAGSINSNQWYDIKIAIQGNTVECYLDNVPTQTFTIPSVSPVYSVASMNDSTREIILKSVNPTAGTVSTNIVLNGTAVIAPTAERTLLTSGSTADENSLAAPANVVPVTSALSTPTARFPLDLPASSVTILRVQTLAAAPENLSVAAGNQQAVLGWSGAAGAATYKVKRATSSEGPFVEIAAGLTGTSFTDTGLTNGTTYCYIVAAVNAAGETESTSPASAIPVLPPVESYELLGPAVRIGEGGVQLTVKSTVSGRVYSLQRRDDLQGGSWQDIGTPQTGTGAPLTRLSLLAGFSGSDR